MALKFYLGTVKKNVLISFFSDKNTWYVENKKLLKSYEISHQTFNDRGCFSGVLIVNFVQVLGSGFRDVFSILLTSMLGHFVMMTKLRSNRSQMFFKIGVKKNIKKFKKFLKKFRKCHRKTPVVESFLIKLQVCNFIKKRLQHKYFPVKFAKFLRTPFFTKHLRWLLLKAPS